MLGEKERYGAFAVRALLFVRDVRGKVRAVSGLSRGGCRSCQNIWMNGLGGMKWVVNIAGSCMAFDYRL